MNRFTVTLLALGLAFFSGWLFAKRCGSPVVGWLSLVRLW